MKIRRENVGRALLLRRKALGDCLVTLPAVRQLAAALPPACLDLVIDRPFAPLIQRLVPEVSVVAYDGDRGAGHWYRRWRAGRYDLVIDWLGSPRTALWTAATGAAWRVGYDLPRRRWAYNIRVPRNREGKRPLRSFAGEAFLDPLRSLGLPVPPWRPDPFALHLETQDLGSRYLRWRDEYFAGPGETVAMMMSATWPAKAWPMHHVRDLWHALRDTGRRGLFIPGPGDAELVEALLSSVPAEAVAPATTLLELADLLGRCRVFVGTDCGPRHLATALGLPTVTVFGPTDPMGWNPADPRHVSLSQPVDCLGCDHTICPRPGHPCLDDLGAGVVLAGLEKVMKGVQEG